MHRKEIKFQSWVTCILIYSFAFQTPSTIWNTLSKGCCNVDLCSFIAPNRTTLWCYMWPMNTTLCLNLYSKQSSSHFFQKSTLLRRGKPWLSALAKGESLPFVWVHVIIAMPMPFNIYNYISTCTVPVSHAHELRLIYIDLVQWFSVQSSRRRKCMH